MEKHIVTLGNSDGLMRAVETTRQQIKDAAVSKKPAARDIKTLAKHVFEADWNRHVVFAHFDRVDDHAICMEVTRRKLQEFGITDTNRVDIYLMDEFQSFDDRSTKGNTLKALGMNKGIPGYDPSRALAAGAAMVDQYSDWAN